MKTMYHTIMFATAMSAGLLASSVHTAHAGDFCREFTQNINVGGRIQQGYSTACLQPDGSWQTAVDSPVTATAIPTSDYYYDNSAMEYRYPPQAVTTYPVVVQRNVTIVNPRPVYVRPNVYSLTRDVMFGYDNHYYGHGKHGRHDNRWNASYDDDDDGYYHKPVKGWGRGGDNRHRRVYVD
jgi:hypothetical protein